MLFTAFPVLIFATMDRDIEAHLVLARPELYSTGHYQARQLPAVEMRLGHLTSAGCDVGRELLWDLETGFLDVESCVLCNTDMRALGKTGILCAKCIRAVLCVIANPSLIPGAIQCNALFPMDRWRHRAFALALLRHAQLPRLERLRSKFRGFHAHSKSTCPT